VQFLDGLLVPVGELIVQKLFDYGRFAHSGRAHHYHAPPNFHYRAAAGSAAAVAASRLAAHRGQPYTLLLLARHRLLSFSAKRINDSR